MALNKVGNVEGAIIGKVVYGKMEQKETKTGKQYEEFSTGVQLPNGSTVFVRNRVWPTSRNNAFVAGKVATLETITEDYKDEDIYVSLRFKADKETGENKFATFNSYVSNDGKLKFSAEGFLDIVQFSEDEDENVTLIFTKQDGSEFTRPFKDYNTDLTFAMYIEKVEDGIVYLVDGKENYPNKSAINVPENVAEQLVLGQMYAFKVKFVKGAKIETKEVKDEIDEIFSFGDDFSVDSLKNSGRSEYESDKLNLVKGGIIKGHSISIFTGESEGMDTRISEDDDDMPF